MRVQRQGFKRVNLVEEIKGEMGLYLGKWGSVNRRRLQ